MIARARDIHHSGVPMALSSKDIAAFLDVHEAPCELYILTECITALDSLFLDKAYKKMSKKSA